MSFRVCQALFSKLFKFFQKFLSAACRPDAFYHTCLRLSRTFFRSFQRIYTLHFWAEFFDFFRRSTQSSSVCGLFCSALSSAWIYYHTALHLSTPFFIFFRKSSQNGNCVHFWLKTVQKPWFWVQNCSFSCYPFLSKNAGVFGPWTMTILLFILLLFSPPTPLLAGGKGNSVTEFAVQDGRVSNGVMATTLSVRHIYLYRQTALMEGGGTSRAPSPTFSEYHGNIGVWAEKPWYAAIFSDLQSISEFILPAYYYLQNTHFAPNMTQQSTAADLNIGGCFLVFQNCLND